MVDHTERALVLGSNGGVARAVLSVLEHTVPGRLLRNRLDAVLLADCEPQQDESPLNDGVRLPPTRVTSAEDLARLVREHRITEVIDLSSLDTVDCTRVCDDLGAHFLCTSVEEWPGQGSIPTDEAIARLLVPRRPALTERSHLVGSGANPGIVNALVFAAIEELAGRVRVPPSVDALDLHSILFTEEDTTVEHDDPGTDDAFPMTWSPTHCLEELFEPTAFAAREGHVVSLDHPPTARWYRARCGDRMIEGMAVPHEEIATLARRLPVEIGFLYRIPAASRRALAAHPDRRPEAWPTRRMYPPWTTALSGRDRVGVLLCSRTYGELWMGFDTDVTYGLSLGANATQLQVAAGVLAGWAQLGRRIGIHFVEDLDWLEFLDVATSVLGPPIVVHDPSARPMRLADRVVEGCSSTP